jgi:LysM repeat protein
MKIKSGTGTDMIRYACGIAVAIFLLVDVPSGWSQQQYLYSPTTVGAEGNAQGKDGVLVQDVPVQKGDTLYGISRKFSGHGSYYPQILLFNDIKDPNRIYPGNVFKVPIPRNTVSGQIDKVSLKNEKSAEPVSAAIVPTSADAPAVQKQTPVTDLSLHDLKKVDTGKEKKRTAKEKGTATAKKQAAGEKQHAATGSTQAQKLFENAMKAYRQDDCKTALELFDRFLAENQGSPLAADASLYKAECYLKLSSQN